MRRSVRRSCSGWISTAPSTTVTEDLLFPNGSVLTDDGVLLVAETFGNRVTAFDVAADGSLSGRRTWAQFGPVPASLIP